MKNTFTKKEIKLKSGEIIPLGAPVTVKFDELTPHLALVTTPSIGREIKLRATNCFQYFKGFAKPPGMTAMMRQMDDGICRSICGEKVEPDGYDQHGSPSWALAMGII